jgi:ankyrin repeat protein
MMKLPRYLFLILLTLSASIVGVGQGPASDAALRKAAQDGDMTAVKDLLAKGANVNARDDKGQTALLWVAPARDNPEMAQLLIDKGADVNAKDNEGETALMIAASQSNPGILAALIEAGAEVNAQSNSGRTALMAAAARANLEEIKILLAKDADLKLKDNKGKFAFDYAKEGSKNYSDETNKKRFAEALKLLDVPID